MNHGSLFSGVGGFDLAAQWMGWNNDFHCEWNPFGQKVLKHYWPNAISYNDITKSDFTIHRGGVDILTGGFPCQPYSTAGKRLGKEDDRHLWPEMLRVIREVQPRWVVGENVGGLLSWNGGLVFDEVQADLEAEGYEVTPFLLPACSVGAPHRRDRIWFVAYSYGDRWKRKRKSAKIQTRANKPECDRELEGGFKRLFGNGIAPNASSTRLQGGKINRGIAGIGQIREQQPARFLPPDWQEFPTQPPVCDRNDGISDRLVGITFPKWRNESIKAMGNAIVPEVAHQIFKSIQQYEDNNPQFWKAKRKCQLSWPDAPKAKHEQINPFQF